MDSNNIVIAKKFHSITICCDSAKYTYLEAINIFRACCADNLKGAPGLSRRIVAYLRVITQAMDKHTRTKVLYMRGMKSSRAHALDDKKHLRLVPPPEMWD